MIDLRLFDHFDNSHTNPTEIITPMTNRIDFTLDSLRGNALLMDGYDV